MACGSGQVTSLAAEPQPGTMERKLNGQPGEAITAWSRSPAAMQLESAGVACENLPTGSGGCSDVTSKKAAATAQTTANKPATANKPTGTAAPATASKPATANRQATAGKPTTAKTLTAGQRAYETKRAAKAGVSLEKWLDTKQREQQAEQRAKLKAAEAAKPPKKPGFFARLLERAQRPLGSSGATSRTPPR